MDYKMIEEIEDIEMADVEISELEKKRIKKNVKKIVNRKRLKAKRNRRKYIAVACLSIIILSSFSPNVRAQVKDFIFSFNNGGIEKAVDSGYVQNVDNITFSNEDLDIKCENLLIDKGNIALGFDVKFKSKSVLRFLSTDPNGAFNMELELYDENNNIIHKEGVIGNVGGLDYKIKKESSDKAKLKVLLTSSTAKIPSVKNLRIKINSIRIRNKFNKKTLNKNLGWEFKVDTEELMKKYKSIKYDIKNDNKNIKILEAEALPTGLFIKYEYLGKGYQENIVSASKVVLDNGNKYNFNTMSKTREDNGEIILSSILNGISSFDNIEKFYLEIPNLENGQIDKVECIRKDS